jgi:uncharacterized membrane protein
VGSWDALSEAFYISSGGAAVGRSYSYDSGQAFRWTQAGGIVGLPNLGGRAYSAAYGANDQGMTVGAASHTRNGAASAVVWQNGMVSQLPLASGQTSSEATCVNSAGVIGGYVFIPGGQRGCVWNGGAASVITQKARTGSYFLIVYGINDAGRVVGVGRRPE